MALTNRQNASVKAIQTKLATEKKYSHRSLLEYELSCATNAKRYHIYSQEEVMAMYSRDDWDGEKGASKTVHLENHEGKPFKYIVIKRHQTDGYIPNMRAEKGRGRKVEGTGNQLIDEVNCWLTFQLKDEADLLCPILKYFTSKSDKVTATSETMQKNVVIIAQKAVYVGDADDACRKAVEMNALEGYEGEDKYSRYAKLEALSKKQGWRDAMHNPGNSGVIFDYAKGCYKAVFIDYAL